MNGESILIVEDSLINSKVVSRLLAHAGYDVRAVADAEAALLALLSFKPELVLADVQLPGMDGLEMTRRIKRDARMRDVGVIALTAGDAERDKDQALAAGCDGYIAKPIDARTFPRYIREFLDRRKERSRRPRTDLASAGLDGPEFEALRREFLRQGLVGCEEAMATLDGGLDRRALRQRSHQWAGDGGLLGYPEISRLAAEVEEALADDGGTAPPLRELLTKLGFLFADPEAAVELTEEHTVPKHIQESLAGKRVALVGLPAHEAERLCQVLERARARPLVFGFADEPTVPSVRECDLVVLHVCNAIKETAWLKPAVVANPGPHMILIGDRDQLLWLDPAVHAHAAEYVIDTWQPHEILLRMSLALARWALAPACASTAVLPGDRPQTASPRVLIAEDDPIIESVLQLTLENHGMTCRVARNGDDALRLADAEHPQVLVLDVNMPGKDGFEVLEAVRSRSLPVAVVLLTSRHREEDIIRGFRIGADDYMTKPFSPVELVARLRRLVR